MKTLTFDEAIQAMIEGHKVTCYGWGDGEFIYYDNNPDSYTHRSVFDENNKELYASTLIANIDNDWISLGIRGE
jgi:hypothetical protein